MISARSPDLKVPSQLDGAMTLAILGVFGILSIVLFVLKGFIDQLPELFAS
ncbi:hypothetical protein GCM10009680_10700 [Streptomyces yatensis]|uniref:Uncharacterized protein n=1 Tax=Streptomyces yatensis TaxID=155177 RepID=A0ABN2GKL0_9ACTN